VCRGTEAAEPVCDYYAAAFETLFRALVSCRTPVREVACESTGAPACVFELEIPKA
jgi:divinyl protochlorophyllide a 8-vinyl-reductase